MKRTLLAIVAAFMMIASVNAQRLVDIQTEARFITDKMVVELGLSNVQRNNILNINLTYLDGIRSYRDIDSHGWKYRNKQLKHILSDKQWKKYKKSYYFYRPISWRNNAYIHNIYAKYPKQNWRSDKHRPHQQRRLWTTMQATQIRQALQETLQELQESQKRVWQQLA